jgi:hypothetical protein
VIRYTHTYLQDLLQPPSYPNTEPYNHRLTRLGPTSSSAYHDLTIPKHLMSQYTLPKPPVVFSKLRLHWSRILTHILRNLLLAHPLQKERTGFHFEHHSLRSVIRIPDNPSDYSSQPISRVISLAALGRFSISIHSSLVRV